MGIKNNAKTVENNKLIDPLAAAFMTKSQFSKEINVSKNSKKHKKSLGHELDIADLPVRSKEEELRETLELAQKSVESNPSKQLKTAGFYIKSSGLMQNIFSGSTGTFV